MDIKFKEYCRKCKYHYFQKADSMVLGKEFLSHWHYCNIYTAMVKEPLWDQSPSGKMFKQYMDEEECPLYLEYLVSCDSK